jgi:serine/threonine protein kinase
MSDKNRKPDQLVDKLKPTSLLNLANSQSEKQESPPRFDLPTSDQLQPLFPDLEIGDMIGAGGMGCVFRATQTKLDRIIALKVLPAELSDDDLFTERFAREARAMARLNHPGIVGIHDFGSAQDTHYLILEFLDGANLRELQDAGPIDSAEVVQILDNVCTALACRAQSHGRRIRQGGPRITSTSTVCTARCKRKRTPVCITQRATIACCVSCFRGIRSVIGPRESSTARMSV